MHYSINAVVHRNLARRRQNDARPGGGGHQILDVEILSKLLQ